MLGFFKLFLIDSVDLISLKLKKLKRLLDPCKSNRRRKKERQKDLERNWYDSTSHS